MAATTPRPNRPIPHGDAILAVGLLSLFAVLLVPLPTPVMDVLLAANIAGGVVVLVATMAIREPLELSTFPSLLLFTTLFRLALNVASTRLILLQGDAGALIRSFGQFVVGGDYLVGAVVFLILLIIQFVVITKGATRISEVAARFTLDAMPGKQMSIDADLNSGLITEDEARDRRRRIAREAEFYGAMDGASKFVRGDAVAGLAITAVNFLGGTVLGLRAGLPVLEAFKRYGILTIGDGLVAQVPALLISVAAGLLVTKSASEEELPQDLGAQLLRRPRPLAIASGLILGLAFLPGLPTTPFLLLAAGAAALVRAARGARPERPREVPVPAPAAPPEPATPDLIRVDRLAIEVGLGLVRLVDEGEGRGLIGQISRLRRQLAQELGLLVPPIRIRDNLRLQTNEYRFLIGGSEVARGTVLPGRLLAMNPGAADPALDGIEARDPAFGLPALWIPESRRAEAEVKGYSLVEAPVALLTHLTEVLRAHAGEILSREDTAGLVEAVRKECPTLVSDLVPSVLTLGDIQRTLQALLRERVPIRNLPLILESLGDAAARTRDPGALAEAARLRLARSLTEPHLGAGGKLSALLLDPRTEKLFSEILSGGDAEAATRPELTGRLARGIAEEYRRSCEAGKDPVLVVRAPLRRALADLLRPTLPRLPVLSFNEIAHVPAAEPAAVVMVHGD